jgi:hypothetical protein
MKIEIPNKKGAIYQGAQVPRLGLGGSSSKKRRAELPDERNMKYGTGMSIVLSLYPKKFSYTLEGYSHRERCRVPDRKKSTVRRKVKDDNKGPAGGQMI